MIFVLFCSVINTLYSAFQTAFVGFFFPLLNSWLLSRLWIYSFILKQCRQWCCAGIPRLSSISLCISLCPHKILFSWSVSGNCKVGIAGQWLCQHDLYFLFYSSLCCWGLIKVKCSHMTHEVAWLTNASRSLFSSACDYLPLIYHYCDQTCALEAQLCHGNFV